MNRTENSKTEYKQWIQEWILERNTNNEYKEQQQRINTNNNNK